MQLGPCSKPLLTYYQDIDGDQHGNPLVPSTPSCGAPAGYVADSGDCDDHDATWYAGRTRCRGAVNSTDLMTCGSNGNNVIATCSTGCSGGQCRSFATMNTAGYVTCGTVQCTASQGCSILDPGNSPTGPSCGYGSYNNWYATCDGTNDCLNGQVCCDVLPLAGATTAEHTECMAAGSCPYGNMGGYGNLVCEPTGAPCPSGQTCRPSTGYLSVYTCQ
jgi:hypothetical protein